MDRQKKLIIVGAAALFLLIAIIVLVVLAVNNNRNQPDPPEPTPIETIEPIATPTEAPTPTPDPTPAATPTEPGQPVLPGTDSTPAPEETPAATPKPTDASSPDLPGSSSTPKPTTTPKPTPAPAFDFTLPQAGTAGAQINITTTATGISSVEWVLIKKGDIEIEVKANGSSDITGTLNKDGGSISFKNTGSYTLKAVAKTTTGNTLTSARSIAVSAATAPMPGGSTTNPPMVGNGFAFGLPKSAYTDTVVTVSVAAGVETVTWTVLKGGSEVALTDAFTGKLLDDGGMIVFKAEGVYTVTGTTASGSSHTTTITIQKRGAQ